MRPHFTNIEYYRRKKVTKTAKNGRQRSRRREVVQHPNKAYQREMQTAHEAATLVNRLLLTRVNPISIVSGG